MDIADGEEAQALTIVRPAATGIFLTARYRAPVEFRRGPTQGERREHPFFIGQIRQGVLSVHPKGPLGVLVVRIRPEAAHRVLGVPLKELVSVRLDLADLFGMSDMMLLEEMLGQSRGSEERVAYVEALLLRYLRWARPESAAHRAAKMLQTAPELSVARLASDLQMSERQLLRNFRATFGTSPKRFARIARLEKALAAGRDGWAWAKVAQACGFSDQAHMIRDFISIVGQSPQDLFSRALTGEMWGVYDRPVPDRSPRKSAYLCLG